jgi:hypothetical protein
MDTVIPSRSYDIELSLLPATSRLDFMAEQPVCCSLEDTPAVLTVVEEHGRCHCLGEATQWSRLDSTLEVHEHVRTVVHRHHDT